MDIRKSDGSTAAFSEEKLARALHRAQVDDALAKEIVAQTARFIRPGASTQQIHQRVLQALEARDLTAAARYNLKHAMLQLGPTGYPFEEYVARLMEAYGWTTKVGITVPGKCIEHEVDVYGERAGSKKRAVEAKYHNTAGGRSDVKVTLYVYARHLDLEARDPDIRGVLITNTEFTQDAILYGECVGMKMKAWDYPRDEGLAKYIEQKKLYPITVFSEIPRRVVSALVQDGLVLAERLCQMTLDDAHRYQFHKEVFERIQKHARDLCGSSHSS